LAIAFEERGEAGIASFSYIYYTYGMLFAEI
jgi:hypothetical protein